MSKLPISIIKTTPSVRLYRNSKRVIGTFSAAVRRPCLITDCKVEIERCEKEHMFRFRFIDLTEKRGKRVNGNEVSWGLGNVPNLDWVPLGEGSRVFVTEAPDGWWYGDYTDRLE